MSNPLNDRETFDRVYGPATIGLMEPNLWMRIRLYFAPLIIHDTPEGTVIYKRLGQTLVVLAAMTKPSQLDKATES